LYIGLQDFLNGEVDFAHAILPRQET